MQSKNKPIDQTIEPMTKIGNVVLTADALKHLEQLQEDDNDVLEEDIRVMVSAIVFISRNLSNISDDDHEEAMVIMQDLSIIANDLKDLKKP